MAMGSQTSRAAALHILGVLRQAGFTAYLAGGCVRDALLGLEPKDYDVATDATPGDVKRLFRGARNVGEAFGVMLVRSPSGKSSRGDGESSGGRQSEAIVTEVATFRSDAAYEDGRRPSQVHFTDARHDALRRDFTINGLFWDPLTRDKTADDGSIASSEPRDVIPRSNVPTGDDVLAPLTGGLHPSALTNPGSEGLHPSALTEPGEVVLTELPGIIDFVDGVADLRTGMIRAIGDAQARLSEDYLRMLRAVRFAARFGFAIDEGTAAAIVANARHLGLISRERIGQELTWMLTHPTTAPVEAATLLQRLHLDGPTLNEDTADPPLPTLGAVPVGAGLAVSLAAWMLDRHLPGLTTESEPCDLAPRNLDDAIEARDAALMPLRHALERFVGEQGPPLVTRWRKALCLTNDTTAALRGGLALLPEALSWHELSVAKRKRALGSSSWAEASQLLRALEHRNGMATLLAIIESDTVALAQTGITPPPLLDGDDLIALGAKPGPTFRRLLDRAYDLQLESRLTDRPAALAWLKIQVKTG